MLTNCVHLYKATSPNLTICKYLYFFANWSNKPLALYSRTGRHSAARIVCHPNGHHNKPHRENSFEKQRDNRKPALRSCEAQRCQRPCVLCLFLLHLFAFVCSQPLLTLDDEPGRQDYRAPLFWSSEILAWGGGLKSPITYRKTFWTFEMPIYAQSAGSNL